MARNLVLVFGLVLAGGLLVEHGAKLFAGSFTGSAQADEGSPGEHVTGAGLTSSPGGIGAVSGAMLSSEASKYGWNAGEIGAWIKVLEHESGGRPDALGSTVASAASVPNVPGGGKRAWGVGQFLGKTLADYLPFGAGSHAPGPQLSAMGKYIHDRYGTPSAALAHEQAHNWY